MTVNDRKQVALLGVIAGIADKNYFNELSPKFLEIASAGMEGYSKLSSDKEFRRELPKITKFFEYIDNAIVEKNWKSSMIFLLSFVLGLSSDLLLRFLKNPEKRKVWEQLSDLAEKELSKNFQNFDEELLKAEEMLQMIYQFEWE